MMAESQRIVSAVLAADHLHAPQERAVEGPDRTALTLGRQARKTIGPGVLTIPRPLPLC